LSGLAGTTLNVDGWRLMHDAVNTSAPSMPEAQAIFAARISIWNLYTRYNTIQGASV
jgi:hypothetical protein